MWDNVVNFLKPYGGGLARVCNPHGVLRQAAEWSGCSWHCSLQKKQLHVVLCCVDGIRRRRLLSLSVLLAFAGRGPRLHCLGSTLFSLRAQWRFLPLDSFDFAGQPTLAAGHSSFKREKGGVPPWKAMLSIPSEKMDTAPTDSTHKKS